MDTIFAEATPPGRGGVSIVRISGPLSRKVLEALTGALPEARRSYLRAVRDAGELIDRAMVLRFEEGHSFTGEESGEFHLHGAPVVVNRLTESLVKRGLRRAEAGEFTRRAFLNGKMDLAETEGFADLLSAETEAQRKLAMRASDGEIGRMADSLRERLVHAGALIEVSIDFADEEVPDEVPVEVFTLVDSVRADIRKLLKSYPATERLRQGYEVAIVGPPNAGKSTLLNRIGKRDIALVSNIPGTTRDVLELATDLRGLPVTFLDTAGNRTSDDPVEAMGVERGTRRAASADLRLHLSATGDFPVDEGEDDILIHSKSDIYARNGLAISAETGDGVEELLLLVYDRLRCRAEESGLIGHKRQAEALERADSTLAVSPEMPPEMLAEALRHASLCLAEMVGRVGSEDYLDKIFSSFCIGK
ncbi:tRNA uridine-5-carboxymethylaminomethyl(34) synthesis GTPase MnmE [Paracoccus ravus]|uniref:tRNA uridine-5-carboxymethylaminomethyl(34) synthesis GTPase MnmE n=1 Tax=Paracoccus ravus TaxID=2447760 RepID=UPI00106E35E8|nr:tRNA uridine-5-carboxymethylaminomethyl(34) synthesis GTPase MnmE [Paracoccus ravus]